MRPYRDIATLVGAQIICFLLLTHLEPSLFLIHLYQSILYVAILVMLFYMEDCWAYMIGMLASLGWQWLIRPEYSIAPSSASRRREPPAWP